MISLDTHVIHAEFPYGKFNAAIFRKKSFINNLELSEVYKKSHQGNS